MKKSVKKPKDPGETVKLKDPKAKSAAKVKGGAFHITKNVKV